MSRNGGAKEPLVDAMLPIDSLSSVAAGAYRLDEAGFPRIYVAEGAHDPFVLATVVAQTTSVAEVGIDVAIAFARTPMTIAYSAWDLQALSGGRFVLGLGPQVRGHITRRYSMPWSRPAARMREFVVALRAIWAAWENGDNSAFEGDFYHHTLVGAPFSPGPNPFGRPRVLLAGVGPAMIAVAGEVADGFLTHPFNTPDVIDRVVLPALERGRDARNSIGDSFEIVAQFMVASGETDEEMAAAREAARAQVAFYGSTPAYRSVLSDPDLHERLYTLSCQQQWSEMAPLVPDELLERVAIVAKPADVMSRARERAVGWADRVVLMAPGGVAPAGPEATLAWYEQLAAPRSR